MTMPIAITLLENPRAVLDPPLRAEIVLPNPVKAFIDLPGPAILAGMRTITIQVANARPFLDSFVSTEAGVIILSRCYISGHTELQI